MTILNPQQAPIVNEPIERTVKIVAGAGTGKTRVIVERYLKFVFDDGVAPDRILALTFTKKAASEMQKRVFEQVEARGERDILRELYAAWIMNFHQFAYRIIKENAPAFAVDPDVTAATEVDLARVEQTLRRRFEAGTLPGLPETYDEDMPTPAGLGEQFDKCLGIMHKARGTLWTPEMLLETVTADDLPGYSRYLETVAAVWGAYEDELARRRLVDFNDMIRMAVDGLRHNDDLRETYSRRFDHVLVDEFQDTSEAQNELLKALAGDGFERVTVVGDEKQSIYRWRDARVDNLRDFGGAERFLQINYRSTQNVLDLAYHFIVDDPYFAARKEGIELHAERGAAVAPVCVYHPPDGTAKSPQAEAEALGAWILSITGRLAPDGTPYPVAGLDYGDIAILMRSLKTSSGLPEYEDELRRLDIPYAILGGVSSLEHRVLKLFKELLTLLVDPNDIKSLFAILEDEPFSIPDYALRTMFADRTTDYRLLLPENGLLAVDDAVVRGRCALLRGLLEHLAARHTRLDLVAFLSDAIEMAHFHYRFFSDGADAKLVDAAFKWVFELVGGLINRNETNLAAFLESVQVLLDRKALETDTPYLPVGRVKIMTVHQAKGLEFTAVAIPGIKRAPSQGDGFCLVRNDGLYIRDGDRWNRGTKTCAPYQALKLEREQEERCLLYVAITRAKDRLFLSSPFADGLEGKKQNPFAIMLDVLRSRDIDYREVRTPPEILGTRRAAGAGSARDGAGLTRVLDGWLRGRERIDEARSPVTPLAPSIRHVSWRELRAFQTCPLQYYFRHVALIDDRAGPVATAGTAYDGETVLDVDGVPLPAGVDPVVFGDLIHRVLFEWTLGGGDSSPVDGLGKVADRYEFGEDSRATIIDGARRILAAFAQTDLAHNGSIFGAEIPVRLRLDRLVFHGVVDRIDRSGAMHRIIDYKVGVPRDAYGFQVHFYAWLLNRVFDGSVAGGAICYLLDPARVVDIDVDPEALAPLDSSARELEEAVVSNHFQATPGAVCRSCAFNGFCPHATA